MNYFFIIQEEQIVFFGWMPRGDVRYLAQRLGLGLFLFGFWALTTQGDVFLNWAKLCACLAPSTGPSLNRLCLTESGVPHTQADAVP